MCNYDSKSFFTMIDYDKNYDNNNDNNNENFNHNDNV